MPASTNGVLTKAQRKPLGLNYRLQQHAQRDVLLQLKLHVWCGPSRTAELSSEIQMRTLFLFTL